MKAPLDPLMALLRTKIGLRMSFRLRAALSRRLQAFEVSLAGKIAPDERVIAGPFAGMLYPVRNLGTSMILPKLLGTYEEELHDEVASILQRPYTDVVDIGCGEGYYAVGLALGLVGAHVHAFDIDPAAVRATLDLARLNGVAARVSATEGCSPSQLASLNVGSRLLMVSDCEGAEFDLIDPKCLPRAASIDLLIECHECGPDTSISDELRQRFKDSHEAKILTGRERDPSQYPRLAEFSGGELELALSESRPPEMHWLSLVQRSQPGS